MFPFEDELKQKTARLAFLNAELNMDRSSETETKQQTIHVPQTPSNDAIFDAAMQMLEQQSADSEIDESYEI